MLAVWEAFEEHVGCQGSSWGGVQHFGSHFGEPIVETISLSTFAQVPGHVEWLLTLWESFWGANCRDNQLKYLAKVGMGFSTPFCQRWGPLWGANCRDNQLKYLSLWSSFGQKS